jgi:DNA-binding transcriptional LysR family regulator
MSNPLLTLPPLDAVRGFVAVAQRMSMTLAAQDLCLTQSAVSRQIKTLEAHLGTPLLIRRHRAIVLTDAGERLFELAAPWLDALAVYTETVRRREQAGPVTISASVGVASLWILPRLGAFQAAHPSIDVRLATSNQIVDLRREGVDLAIRYCPHHAAPDNALKLFDEQLAPVASPQVAARAFAGVHGLQGQVLIDYDDRARPWLQWANWLRANGRADVKPKTCLRFNQYDQVIQAAIAGHGVALGRLALIAPMLADGRLAAQPTATAPRSDCGYAYWLISAPEPVRGEVRILRDWIVGQARAPSHV